MEKPQNRWPTPVRRVLRRLLPERTFTRHVGRHEEMSLRVWQALVTAAPPGSTVLDVGAHVGEYSFAARNLRDDIDIVAFEPDPASASRLRQSAEPRGIDVRELASSNVDGQLAFAIDGAMSHLVSSTDSVDNPNRVISVRSSTLDSVAADLGMVSVIKIDVEGGEAAVLRGGNSLISQFRPIILLEVLSNEAAREVHEVILNMATFRIDENKGLTPEGRIDRREWRNKNWLLVPLGPGAAGDQSGS